MSYYQKFMTTFAIKRWVLLLIAGCFTLTGMAQPYANFSGEWKLNESKSELGGRFPLCIFGGDRMRSKTLKIAAFADFLTVDAASSSRDGALITRQDKLTFDGKESEASYVGIPRAKSSAKWSDEDQTITVNSVRSFDKNAKTADFKVTEVWKLVNGGKSISIQVNARSSSGENTMKLVYDRQWAADHRF